MLHLEIRIKLLTLTGSVHGHLLHVEKNIEGSSKGVPFYLQRLDKAVPCVAVFVL